MLLFSFAAMSLSILLLAVYFYLLDHVAVDCSQSADAVSSTMCTTVDGKFDPETVEKLGWLPLVSLVLYITGTYNIIVLILLSMF